MTHVVVWAPRTPSHYEELVTYLREESPVVDPVSGTAFRADVSPSVDKKGGKDGDTFEFTLEYTPIGAASEGFRGAVADVVTRAGSTTTPSVDSWKDGGSLRCRYTAIGTLTAEVPEPEPMPTDEEEREAALETVIEATRDTLTDFYTHVARTEWEVLGRQLDSGNVPLGVATVEEDYCNRLLGFRAVCYEFLSDAVRMTRDFDAYSDETEISNLLQRVEQAETCFNYAVAEWGLEDEELRHHVDYATEIVGMLFKKIEIKSDKGLQRTAILGTALIFGLGAVQFAVAQGVSLPTTVIEWLAVGGVTLGFVLTVLLFAAKQGVVSLGQRLRRTTVVTTILSVLTGGVGFAVEAGLLAV